MVDLADAARAVSTRLGHEFRDPACLREALTHRSYAHENPDLGVGDNERLEFVGDAIVGAAAAALLHQTFPSAREGELTRRRADLVCERSLAALARELGIGEALRLGKGEERSGGREKPRLLASALEACIAAVSMDAGLHRALEVATALLSPFADTRAPGAFDFKSKVQEVLQGRGDGTPRYEVLATEGPEHERVFTVGLYGADAELAQGTGRSKSEAEQAAAKMALRALQGEA